MIKPRKLRIGLLNAGSLGTGHDEFLFAMDRHNVDIMAINETWLIDGEDGRAPVVSGYFLRHKPRPSGLRERGGGVGFYVRRGFSIQTLSHPEILAVEQMWLSFKASGKIIIVGTAYKPPWLNTRIFVDALMETFSTFSYYDHIILLGDFNINLLDVDNSHINILNELLSVTNMRQFVDRPTHFTNHSESLIDLICSNCEVEGIWVDYVCTLSRHAFISCEIKIAKEKQIREKSYFRQICDVDKDILKSMITTLPWEHIMNEESVNDVLSAFNHNVLEIFNFLAPIKLRYFKDINYPWITYNIKLMIRKRNEAHAKARKTNSSTQIEFYKDMKNVVERAIFSEKSAYFTIFINSNNVNSPYL